MIDAVVLVSAFVAMEPVAALAHRAVMHGRRGWSWHRSHHRVRRDPGVEANDLFPVCFATATVAVMASAEALGWAGVVAAGLGVSLYGLVYFTVHDVCVHGRLSGGRPLVAGRWLRWVADRHAVHHRTGRAPYGFLVPVAGVAVSLGQ